MGYGFSKKLRLLTSADFRRVFKTRRKVIVGDFSAFFRRNDLDYPRLGLIVAKREVAKAVQRNKMKRRLRENFRLHQERLNGFDIIIRVRKEASIASAQQFEEKLRILWKKLAS